MDQQKERKRQNSVDSEEVDESKVIQYQNFTVRREMRIRDGSLVSPESGSINAGTFVSFNQSNQFTAEKAPGKFKVIE